jgi:hypothetical protein
MALMQCSLMQAGTEVALTATALVPAACQLRG